MITSIEKYQSNMIELKYLNIIAESYNLLDYKLLESIISDDIEYTSFWVFETLRGKDVLDYLRIKFDTISHSSDLNSDRIFAEIGYLRDHDDRPIIILSQGIENRLKIDALILITVEDNTVKTIEITSGHFFQKIRCTGTYPGLET